LRAEQLPHTRPTAKLRTSAVTAGYGAAPVVHGITVEVGLGEIVSIVGPNGSGKSTLLKSIVGIVTVLSGQVWLGDVNITNQPTEIIARLGVGYIPQVDDIFETLTVRENLEMGGYLLRSSEVPDHIDAVIDTFPRLATMMSRRAGKLSGGERKMLAMGRVLMLRPAVCVLDEPTANLAPIMAHELLEQHVRQLAATGAAVLLVEQRARAALAISDWAYVLGGGTCRAEGTPTDLGTSAEFVESFLGGSRDKGG